MPSSGTGGTGGSNYGGGRFAHQNVDFKANNAGGGSGSAYKAPKNIINALSEIQRYYVLESRSDDLPKEYFTLEQIFDFFKIGFKSGILEGLLFITLLPFLQTIYPGFKFYFLGDALNNQEEMLFTVSSYAPIVISTIFMVYLSKYYEGGLTKRAIFALINGRSSTFIIKGVGIYYLLHYIQELSLKDPNVVYSWIDFSQWIFSFFTTHELTAEMIYNYYYRFVIPALGDTANEIFFSMLIFAFFPYLTVFYKGYVNTREKYRMEEEYENY
ncbi:hypothetical protein CIG1485E_a0063 (plasmid) [Campylobacter iguaniorum]|uniref:Uncharacterized protein n=1 Tax=Campylobacter iguaniorum TaxID=1244531 RepID=A0A076FD57_9BACT|nr:hypothetical protein [Campylobacter iguaniorum]AII15588.1 hypothetical protein CIG1485E_a0063 [Campylobacter iguaniorum]